MRLCRPERLLKDYLLVIKKGNNIKAGSLIFNFSLSSSYDKLDDYYFPCSLNHG